MKEYVELYAVFNLFGKEWSAWTCESRPTVGNSGHVRLIRIPVPEELLISQGPDAELVEEEPNESPVEETTHA